MKYIIEFEDEPYMREDGVDYYTCKSARWYKLGDTIINRLEPYTEPDLSPLVDEAVEAIENEVWELADYMCKMSPTERTLCFAFEYPSEVTTNLTYQEAKALFEKWMESENEIHVGDEVVHKDYPTCKAVVTKLYQSGYLCAEVLFPDGMTDKEIIVSNLIKTGRHFDEVAELLEKMRGEEE